MQIFQMTKLACLFVYAVLAIIPVVYATDSNPKTIKMDIAPEYFESSVTPCSLFSLSCKSVCGTQLSSTSCDIAKGSNHAALDCTCGLVRWKSCAASQIFQPITVQVSKLDDGKFCDMFKAECQKTSTGVVVANGCRPSESGAPNKVDTTCISVTDSKFDRHEDEINGRLNRNSLKSKLIFAPRKISPPKPQVTTVESKYAGEACGVFSSLCDLKREPECLSEGKINTCSNSLGNNQLEVQCSCGNTDFTSELVKAMNPTLISVNSSCISKDICGLFKSDCPKECDVAPLMNVCYVPYIITNFRVGCICGNGSPKTSAVLDSMRKNGCNGCNMTTIQT